MPIKRYEISDYPWNQIKHLFLTANTGRPPKDNHKIINVVLWITQSVAAWRDLPERFGSWKTVYSRFCKWRNDGTLAIDVLSHVELPGSNVLRDKAYSTVAIKKHITSRGATYTIPPKSNTVNPWECDFHVYKKRHLVECFFNKLRHFRRVATCYDKLAVSFTVFMYVAAILILSK